LSKLEKAQGLTLSFLRYRESSVIAKIFTRAFGIRTYLINGVRTHKKSLFPIALLEPMNQVELMAYHTQEGGLHRLSSLHALRAYRHIPLHFPKRTLLAYMAESLSKTLGEQEQQPELFDFTVNLLNLLDSEETKNLANIAPSYLFYLAECLGFRLETAEELLQQTAFKQEHFALQKGIDFLLAHPFSPHDAGLTADGRKALIGLMNRFFSIHIAHFKPIHSAEILHDVFN